MTLRFSASIILSYLNHLLPKSLTVELDNRQSRCHDEALHPHHENHNHQSRNNKEVPHPPCPLGNSLFYNYNRNNKPPWQSHKTILLRKGHSPITSFLPIPTSIDLQPRNLPPNRHHNPLPHPTQTHPRYPPPYSIPLALSRFIFSPADHVSTPGL